ncbi:plasmid replication protein RepC [Rhizobium sp. AAP43]|uniref:plasmid replication protein RepC n=1 Tax=Rhizobium sp. AAP43 TaxID=1523420 RepID=UPI0006B95A77|nr:plasmid replication protein RepC [Rhizobium sp. AAP43]KPF41319.1 replication initiation protein [Rhizobium sp. AAP43]
MIERLGTTPFGGGRMSARLFARQTMVAERQGKLRAGDGGNDTGTADKWQLLRALTEAREHFDLSDRAIGLLEALVSFTTERTLDGSKPIIVFPSNRELSIRARGMAPATIRRHLAALVDAGLLFRRDSANGKRYCLRGDHGDVEEAFGFDLAPLALKATEIHALAETVRAEAKALRQLRTEVTLHLRDISKIITAALEEARTGDWEGMLLTFQSMSFAALPRKAQPDALRALRDRLATFRLEVENAYLSSLSEEEMSANDHHSERHYQNSNTDLPFELNGKESKKEAKAESPERDGADRQEKRVAISLDRLRKICPQIGDYCPGGMRGWQDLLKAADLVRSMLGVSPDAWAKAKKAMGEQAAAIVIALILERAEEIRSPGGYLRDLTRKAERSAFSILAMLQALERHKD